MHSAEVKEYESEVLSAIRGTSKFSSELLNKLYNDAKENAEAARVRIDKLMQELSESEKLKDDLNGKFTRLKSWADMYDSCSLEAQKMIVAEIMPSIRVKRDYELEIHLNATYEQFGLSLEDLGDLDVVS